MQVIRSYKRYAEDVISGKQVAGRYIRLACQRFLDWFDREDIYFDVDKVDKVINFISKLIMKDGKTAGKPFVLEPWQLWVLANIFGWYYKDTCLRVTNKVLLLMARKNGKSCFAAAISLYCLIGDGEKGAQILNVANNRDLAKLLFDMTLHFAKHLDPNHRYLRILRDRIRFDATSSYARTLSSDASGLDGLSASTALLDETHEFSDSRLYDVLSSSLGFRDNPLIIQISTTGFKLFGFLKEYRDNCVDVLEGTKLDDNLFSAIYELDEDDDWKDELVWVKANPNIDITTTRKFLRTLVRDAINNPRLEVGVRTKLFNQWVQSSETWILDEYINNVMQDFDIKWLKDKYGDGLQAYIGVDLATVSDISSVAMFVKTPDRAYFKTWNFLPEDTIEKSKNRPLYEQFIREGFLTVTEGNVADFRVITDLLLEIQNEIPIVKVAYDKWDATLWAIEATEQGLPLVPFSQSLGNFSGPTKEFERLVLSGRAVICRNMLVRWALNNVVIKEDWNNNIKPTKDSRDAKIDPVISMIEALGAMLYDPTYGGTDIMVLKFN